MNSPIKTITLLLILLAFTRAQTAVLFGGSGAVGSEVLKSLLNNSNFQEVILIGRKSYPKVDEILATKKADSKPNFTALTLPDLKDLDSFDKIDKADACFIAVGIGDVNIVTFEYWHSIEVDLIGTIAKFCDKVHVRSLTLLSAIDVEYESAEPYSEEEIHTENQKPMGWAKSISRYYRMKGLEEKAAIMNAKNVPHIRLFQPSTIVTEEYRYGWVDRTIFAFHAVFDPYVPTQYHSVDVRLLGMAMVADAKKILHSSVGQDASESILAKVTYADYINIAGEAFEEQYQPKHSEL